MMPSAARPFLILAACTIGSALTWMGCTYPSALASDLFTAEDLRLADRRLLEVAMVDAFSPPVASRVYVYPHVAHYATLRLFAPDSLPALEVALNSWPSLSGVDTTGAHGELTALLAFCGVARKVVFSEQAMDSLAQQFVTKGRKAGMDEQRLAASERCAEEIRSRLVQWIDADNYIRTRSMDRYTSRKEPGHWIETPPDHTPALEPHWGLMRTLLLDTASGFTLEPPPPYDGDASSPFRRMVTEVYEASRLLTDEQRNAALYWDDNPNVSHHVGHLITMQHKISPPGHWLHIVGTYTRASQLDVYRTAQAYTLTALSMYDGLIACWHHKFDTDLVRPITYIQEYIQPDWYPLIQTPPFPEFPSGHAVVSTSAATVLEHLFGPDVSFTDSTEVIFGMGTRSYARFKDAADEVSLSRFHAGIHYRHGVVEGQHLGRLVGEVVLDRGLR